MGYRPWGCKELHDHTTFTFTLSLPIVQLVKNLPAVQETWVQSPGREDPLEKEMATHSSILGLENPMARGAWRAAVHGVLRPWGLS